jgi:hypothetical protein
MERARIALTRGDSRNADFWIRRAEGEDASVPAGVFRYLLTVWNGRPDASMLARSISHGAAVRKRLRFLLSLEEERSRGSTWGALATIVDTQVQSFPQEPAGWLVRAYLEYLKEIGEVCSVLEVGRRASDSDTLLYPPLVRRVRRVSERWDEHRTPIFQRACVLRSPLLSGMVCRILKDVRSLRPRDWVHQQGTMIRRGGHLPGLRYVEFHFDGLGGSIFSHRLASWRLWRLCHASGRPQDDGSS